MASLPVDDRLRSFVIWHGEVPVEATRVEDWAARAHTASWIRRTIGKGVAGSYVIGYGLADQWWTFFFDRERRPAPSGAESWYIEAYAHNGKSWTERFFYWPAADRWRHELHQQHGDDHGRFRK